MATSDSHHARLIAVAALGCVWLPKYDQDAVIAFLESLQVLPPGTKGLMVDERHQPRVWPPAKQIP